VWLVVSAAEGVQPQTIESINHARAAGVPIVVAMNKIDRPDANDQKVLGDWPPKGSTPPSGRHTEVVRTAPPPARALKELIEILDYQSSCSAESQPGATARGTVIESRVDEGMGPVATVLVQDGTLKVGDVILAGPSYGRVRSIRDDLVARLPKPARACGHRQRFGRSAGPARSSTWWKTPTAPKESPKTAPCEPAWRRCRPEPRHHENLLATMQRRRADDQPHHQGRHARLA